MKKRNTSTTSNTCSPVSSGSTAFHIAVCFLIVCLFRFDFLRIVKEIPWGKIFIKTFEFWLFSSGTLFLWNLFAASLCFGCSLLGEMKSFSWGFYNCLFRNSGVSDFTEICVKTEVEMSLFRYIWCVCDVVANVWDGLILGCAVPRESAWRNQLLSE